MFRKETSTVFVNSLTDKRMECMNFEGSQAMMVFYFHVKFEVDWSDPSNVFTGHC